MFRQRLRAWFEDSKIHRFSHIVQVERLLLRLAWLIGFFTCFGLCAYYVVIVFVNYYQYQTTISVELATETPTDFPVLS